MAKISTDKKLLTNFINFFLIISIFLICFFLIKISIETNKLVKEKIILNNYRNNYIFFSILINYLKNVDIYFILSLIVIVNLLSRQAKLKEKYPETNYRTYTKFFSKALIIFFALILLSHEFLIPYFSKMINDFKSKTILSYKYLEEAEKYRELGNKNLTINPKAAGEYYKISLEYYKKYLYFEPKNQKVIELINELNLRQTTGTSIKEKEKEDKLDPKDIESYYKKALYHYNKNEYILTIYYIEKYRYFIKNNEDANRIYEIAKLKVEEEKTKINKKNKEIFETKIKGINELNNKKYVEAYYTFKNLKEKYPEEKSILPYYEEALNLYKKLDFFISDAEKYINYPGIYKILIKANDEKNKEYIVYIDKLVEMYNEIYIYNTTLYDIQNKNLITYKWGKKINNYFILKNYENQSIIFKYDLSYSNLKNFLNYGNENTFSIIIYPLLRNFIINSGYSIEIIDTIFSKRIIFYIFFILFSVFIFNYSYSTRLLKIEDNYNLIELFLFIFITIFIGSFLYPVMKESLYKLYFIVSIFLKFPLNLISIVIFSILLIFFLFMFNENRHSD
ncbi:MAG: hypothetical protein N3A58_07405 [Spirochaetes bacterium]|nr:hypothetical protein [Spirochaetota bacterium]